MRYCPKCRQTLKVEQFYQSANGKYTPYCRVCWLELCRARHAKKRAGMVDKRHIHFDHTHHNYFACIEYPLQAYILGLLASDGNVNASRPRIKLSVHQKDRELVELLKEELCPSVPLFAYKQMIELRFTSPKMVEDLAKLNVVPRKSLTLMWPDALPSHLTNSFLLGIFDGDGHLTLDKRKINPHYVVGFMSASRPFLERVAEEIESALGIAMPRLGWINHRALSIRYSGKYAILVNQWIHRDVAGLARKRIERKE